MRYIIIFSLIGVLVAVIMLPQLRQVWLIFRSEDVTLSRSGTASGASGGSTLNWQIITVLGKDGIPSIGNPEFVSEGEANSQMQPNERVLGVSINGDHRAYSLSMLSRHEIVNDTVGGMPIAVTW